MRKLKHLIILLVLLLGTGWMVMSSASQVEPLIPHTDSSQIVADGIIGSEEYTHYYEETKSGMTVYWEHDGINMYIGLVSPGQGWSAIAFGPQGIGMDESNIIIGYVDDTGALTIVDSIGEGLSHMMDTERDGTDDLGAYSGTQSASETIIEFVFPLNSGDSKDHSFEPGNTYGFFVAYHETADNFADYHGARSDSLTVKVGIPGELPPQPLPTGIETELTIEVSDTVAQQDPFTINARLVDEEGTPVEGATIQLYLVTTFGDLHLDEALTNAEGLAQLEYTHTRPDQIELKVVFEKTPEFENSEATTQIFVFMSEPLETDSPDVLRIPGTGAEVSIDVLILSLTLIFVFGSIYVTYSQIFYDLLQIPKSKEDEVIRPRELRSIDVDLESKE